MNTTFTQSHPKAITLNPFIFRNALLFVCLICCCSRVEAVTYTVSNTNDAGVGSLRQAITDANGNTIGLSTVGLRSITTGTSV